MHQQNGHGDGEAAPTGGGSGEWSPEEMRDWIDRQDFQGLLRWWRFAPAGDPFFQGETGEHYSREMARRRGLEPDGGASASRRVGWDDPGESARPRKPGA